MGLLWSPSLRNFLQWTAALSITYVEEGQTRCEKVTLAPSERVDSSLLPPSTFNSSTDPGFSPDSKHNSITRKEKEQLRYLRAMNALSGVLCQEIRINFSCHGVIDQIITPSACKSLDLTCRLVAKGRAAGVGNTFQAALQRLLWIWPREQKGL